jgi:endo-1,4-beta-xylanase
MLIKKVVSILTATVMWVGLPTVFFPKTTTFTTEAAVVSDNFDVSYDGWTNCGEKTKLVSVDTIRHNGSRSMFVSNRQSNTDGAYSQKGFYIDSGVQYDYSVFVYQ